VVVYALKQPCGERANSTISYDYDKEKKNRDHFLRAGAHREADRNRTLFRLPDQQRNPDGAGGGRSSAGGSRENLSVAGTGAGAPGQDLSR
jgi:hypothetical protein